MKKAKVKGKTKEKLTQPTSEEYRVKKQLARIKVKYDVGFNNTLYIRGSNAGLNWEKGVMMNNVGPDEWIWETSLSFKDCEFKVLINDEQYEIGENHHLSPGAVLEYSPAFP